MSTRKVSSTLVGGGLVVVLAAVGIWRIQAPKPTFSGGVPAGTRYVAEGFGGFAKDVKASASASPAPVAPALAALSRQDFPEALKAARKTLETVRPATTSSTERRARLRARKIEGFALARQGDMKGAKEAFTQLVREGATLSEGTTRPAAPLGQPEKAALVEDALYQKAICTAALGDKVGAEREFHDLMRTYPESPLMLAALKRVARMHEGNIPKETEALWRSAMDLRQSKEKEAKRAQAMCGPQCLAELMKRSGKGSVSVESLARELQTDEQGTSLLALRDVARRHGWPSAEGVQLTLAGLKEQRLPLLALVAPGHFVLVESVTDKVTIWDPQAASAGSRRVSLAEWATLWGAGYSLSL